MNSKPSINPLLFPASSNSAFEDLQGSAVLIPPSLNEAQSYEVGDGGSILGQQQMPEIDLRDSFGISNQDSTFGRPQVGAPQALSNIVTASEVTPSLAQLPHPSAPIPSVIPQFSRPSVPPPSAIPPFSVSPVPAPSVIPSFQQGPVPISSVIPPYRQSSAPISSVIPPFANSSAPIPSVIPPFPKSGAPNPSVISPFPNSGAPNPSVISPFPKSGAPIPSVIPPFPKSGAPNPSVIPPFPNSGVPNPSVIPPFPNSGAPNPSVISPFQNSGAPIPSVIPPFPNSSAPVATALPPYQSPISKGPPSYPPPRSAIPSGPISHGVYPARTSFPDVKAATPPLPPSLAMGSRQSRLNVNGVPPPSLTPPAASISAASPPEIPVETTVTNVGQSTIGVLSPTLPTGGDSFNTPARDNVIPLSFENVATNPPLQDGVYHPVLHHWFYSVGQPQVWRPFSFKDSFNLEEAFQQGDQGLIATEGGRHDVSITERLRKPIYWEEEPSHVRRCSWFRKGPLETQPIPYDEEMAERLEAEYRDAMTTGQWHRQVDVKGGDRIMIHSTRTMIHYVGLDGDYTSVNGSHSPLSVKRGTEDFEITDGEADEVDHILFLVHGIGSVCDLRFRAVEECVDDFRKLGHQLLSSHFKQSVDMGLVGRVEILPVSWHKALHGDATGIDNKLKPITLRSIPKLREFTNDTILDVLLFTSPIYCQHIMDTVASELNRLYNLFCERNPTFKGLISLGGHSLGSVILFDLLMHQSADDQEKEEEGESPAAKEEISAFGRNNTESVSSPINYVMGGQGTGQPSLVYPKLIFKPEAFFLMGSPYAMFITVRGIDTIGVDYHLPTCKRVFNIFHPFDPVAYRLETLIDPDLINLRPVLIPHHKGRKRMHLELKETIERVGTEFKQKIVDSIQGTWNRLYQFYSGSSTKSIEHEVDEALASQLYLDEEDNQCIASVEQGTPVGRLNGGRRIDYVLQEKPYESFNEYIFALQAHVTYWESEDTMLLILKELYGPQGVSCDAEHSSQQAPASSQLAYEGDSALGSAAVTPTSPPVFDVTNNVLSQPGSKSNASDPPSTTPIPLFTMAPTSSSNMTSYAPSFGFPPSAAASTSPSVIGGRPVVDINTQPKGMDPTALPGDRKAVGPPPKLPTGTFTRSVPFRR